MLGVPHPPGYPLFTMLTHLATLLPVGSPALGANLLSAVLDAAAVTVVAITIYRLVASTAGEAQPRAAIASLVGALMLGFSTTFWLYSLGAEVFPLNNLFAALLLLAGIEFARRPKAWLLAALGLLFGLSLTNQQTIVLIAPALAVLAIVGLRRQLNAEATGIQPPIALLVKELGAAGALVIVGLLPYLYLMAAASHDPLVNWGDPRTLDGLVAVVLRSNYGSLSLSLGVKGGSVIEQWVAQGLDITSGFVVVGVLFAVLGVVTVLRRDSAVAVALLLAFIVSGPMFVAYANPDFSDPVNRGIIARFYILPAIPVAILAGVGVWTCLTWVAARAPRRLALAAALALLVIPVGSVVAHAPVVDQSHNDVTQRYAEDLLRSLPSGAILLMRGDENYTSVSYAQFVEGVRTDVAAMDVELLKQSSYVGLMRRLHPDITIPWNAYAEGPRASLKDLVAANLGQRAVFYVGQMKEANWTAGWDEVHAGLARELVPKGRGGDGYQLLRSQTASFSSLHYPDRAYPDTSWEAIICGHYGVAAFDLAFALQSSGPQSDPALVERMYRAAIRLAPATIVPNAYKNLGVLLQSQGGDPHEIVSLWQRFLQLSPNDPDAPAIRQRIAALGGSP